MKRLPCSSLALASELTTMSISRARSNDSRTPGCRFTLS
jgi:hypothetical protein